MFDWLHRHWRAWREGKTWREVSARYISKDGTVSLSPPPIVAGSNMPPFPMHIGNGEYRLIPAVLLDTTQTIKVSGGAGAFVCGYIHNRWLEGSWLAQREKQNGLG